MGASPLAWPTGVGSETGRDGAVKHSRHTGRQNEERRPGNSRRRFRTPSPRTGADRTIDSSNPRGGRPIPRFRLARTITGPQSAVESDPTPAIHLRRC
jgi:hypothetical protein